MTRAAAWRPLHGWLPAVLPAAVRTFTSADPALTATLAASGAEEVRAGADVELAAGSGEVRGEAPTAVIFLQEAAAEGAGLARRVTARLAGVARVGAEVRDARARLRRLGYDAVSVLPFDQERRAQLAPPGLGDARALPLGAVVVGRRAEDEATVLDAASEAAGASAAGARVGLSGVVLAVGEERVLRVVLRAGEEQLLAGTSFLERLRAGGPPEAVAARVAWPEATGELPLARWVVEPRLPGAPSGEVGDDALGFLAALFAVPLDGDAPGVAENARTVAEACPPDLAAKLTVLGDHLDPVLARMPRGVAHGDFWRDNLLAVDGRLTGVVDWSGAGGGRLPLLDLFHLLVSNESEYLGDAVLAWLLPVAATGASPIVDDFCRRIGLSADPPLLRALAIAYWLDHVAHHLRSYADRAARPAWLERNVYAVARAL